MGTSFQCVEDLHLKNAIYMLRPLGTRRWHCRI
jgi:hypothetical protein